MKKKKKKQKTIVLKESDVKKMKKEITNDVTKMSIYIFLAWLMETEYVDKDPERLVEEYNRLESWCGAIEEHLITVFDIKKIVEDAIGGKVILNGRKGQDDTGPSERE